MLFQPQNDLERALIPATTDPPGEFTQISVSGGQDYFHTIKPFYEEATLEAK
jgi:hypothetical protein